MQRVRSEERRVGKECESGEAGDDVSGQSRNRDGAAGVIADLRVSIEAAVNRQRAVRHLQRDGDRIARVTSGRRHADAADRLRGVLVELYRGGGGSIRRRVVTRVNTYGVGSFG